MCCFPINYIQSGIKISIVKKTLEVNEEMNSSDTHICKSFSMKIMWMFLSMGILVECVLASTTPTILSGSSVFTVSSSEYNSSTVITESITISAGSNAGEVSLVWDDFTYTGIVVGLAMFISGDDGTEKSSMVVVFTDDTFTEAVSSWTFLDTSGTTDTAGFELRHFEKASGDLSATNLHASTVTGSTTFSTTNIDIETNSTSIGSYTFSGDGDSIGAFVDGSENEDLFVYNRFFTFAYARSDGSYGIAYGMFDDDTYSHLVGSYSHKDLNDVVEVGAFEGTGSGTFSVEHTPVYDYSGSSLASYYGWYEYNTAEFEVDDDVFSFTSRSGEVLSGVIENETTSIVGQLIGPVVLATYLNNSEQLFFGYKVYSDANYSDYFGGLVGHDIPSSDGRWGEFSIGAKQSGDLSYSNSTAVIVSISGTPSTSVDVDTAYSFSPTASASDSSSITFSIENKPDWASFNTSTGVLSGTPTVGGLYSGIVITATSGDSSASLTSFSIEVIDSSVTISGTPSPYVVENNSYSFEPTAVDTLLGEISFTISGEPDWLEFSSSTGAVSGTPTVAGNYEDITITATSINGADNLNFSVLVVETLVGKTTAYVTVGGVSQPILDGGLAPFSLSMSESSSSVSLLTDATARDGFQQKLVGESVGTASITVQDASGQELSLAVSSLSADVADFYVDIPALTSSLDYKMITFPFLVSSLAGSELFSELSSTFGTYGEDYILYAYQNGNYEKMTDSSVNVGPGYAYWMGLLNSANVTVTGATSSQSGEVQVQLEEGWNMIGNPYSVAIDTATIAYYKSGESILVEDASQSDLGHVFWELNSANEYDPISSIGVGHAAWIYSSIETNLIFSASTVSTKARFASDSVDLSEEPQPPAFPRASALSTSSSGSSSGGGGGGCLLR